MCRAVARDKRRARAVARARCCAATSTAPATACTRSWLDERLRDASALARWRTELSPYHRYVLGDRAAAVREPVAARGDLQLEDGARRDPRALRPARRAAARHLQRRRQRRVLAGAARSTATRCAQQLGMPDDATRVPAGRLRLRAQGRRGGDRGARAAARPTRICSSSAATRHRARYKRARARARRRAARRVRRPAGRRRSRSTAPPTRSCCRRSTTRARTPRSRRWPAACRSSPAPSAAPPSSSLEHDAGFVCDARDVDALAAHMTHADSMPKRARGTGRNARAKRCCR